MFYLDSSLIVALIAAEPESDRVEEWVSGHSGIKLAASDWVRVEFAAALAAKLRLGALDAVLLQQAFGAFASLRKSLAWLDIGSVDFSTAAHFAGDAQAKLRAGDALHLALAARHEAVLATLDRRQTEAGAALGVKTLLL